LDIVDHDLSALGIICNLYAMMDNIGLCNVA